MSNTVLTILKGQTLDSREVSEMMEKEHKSVLRMIDGSADGKDIGIKPTLERANFVLSKYFIESTYKSGTREYKCYLVTKMGCELLGNKLQGERGILFSAKYVEKFNELENTISQVDKTIKIKGKLTESDWNKIQNKSIYLTEEIHDRKSLRKFIRDYDKMKLDECIDTIGDMTNKMKGVIKHELLDVAIKELKAIDSGLMKDTIKNTFIKDTTCAGIIILQDVKIGKFKKRIKTLENKAI